MPGIKITDPKILHNANDKDNPQKLGSSISYAKRYGLQALYGLGSDDDGNEASKNDNGEVPNAKTTKKIPPKDPLSEVTPIQGDDIERLY